MKSTLVAACSAAAIFTIPLSLSAQNDQVSRSALNNLSSDMSECVAFYAISANGTKRTGRTELAERLEKTGQALYRQAARINQLETVDSRIRAATQEQMKAINHNFENISLLIDRYGEFCLSLASDPGDRLAYWKQRLSRGDR